MSAEGVFIQSLQTFFDSRLGVFLSVFCARWLIFVEVGWILVLGLRKGRPSLRLAAKEAGLAMLVALYTALTASQLIGRIRPFMAETGVHLLVPPPMSVHSLPSAHASAAFALAFGIAWKHPRAAIIPLLFACGVAFGRVAVGVHYPTDVVAGMGVGLLAVLIIRVLRAAVRRTAVYREHTHG